jgi:hypothetical protein
MGEKRKRAVRFCFRTEYQQVKLGGPPTPCGSGKGPAGPTGRLSAARLPMEENIMKRLLSVAAILSLALAGSAWGDPGKGGTKDQEEKVVKDSLPRENRVAWDVRVFEDAPSFTVVKRAVQGNKVTWILENRRSLGSEIVFGYQAALLDEDGVRLQTIGIEGEPFLLNMSKGERNRFTLHLPPPEKWKEVRKVVIVNGN